MGCIAVLIDAENAPTSVFKPVMAQLVTIGSVRNCRAIGDFSNAALGGWVQLAKQGGIELVMQPCLGRGKNSADIALTIEAMELVHAGGIDAMALVTSDRDFAPLALRLRHHGIDVYGFGSAATSETFRTACTQFRSVAPKITKAKVPPVIPKVAKAKVPPVIPKVVKAKGQTVLSINTQQRLQLLRIAQAACQSGGGAIAPIVLNKAVIAADPALATQLSGSGKFLKTLVAHGIVEYVGSGADLLVQTAKLRSA